MRKGKKKKESWKRYASIEALHGWKQHERKIRQEQELWEMTRSFDVVDELKQSFEIALASDRT